ncbi:putative monooxygenase [Thozetella sp. PMI_491]|nr:putative monooxygenase [Thozetella sp. PMI_491]
MSFHKQLGLDSMQSTSAPQDIKFHPPTGISVLVVGAGVGGLMTALECRRKGHDVRVIERAPGPSTAGDFFSIGPNNIRHFYQYFPELGAELEKVNYQVWMSYFKITGERVTEPEGPPIPPTKFTLPDGTEKIIPLHRQNRPKFVAALLAQAQKIGVDVSFGKRVVDYFEDAETQTAGVLLDNGARIIADLVVAADGVGTKSNKLVNGHDIRAYPSGFSIFRTAFPIELATSDPDIAERWPLLQGWRPQIEMWGGKDLHFTVQRCNDIMSWGMMHKDMGTGMESWSQTVDVTKVFEITSQIPDFPEIATRLISKTPKDGLVDWEIMWRDPREAWVSPLGRVVQVGDSAHTFLPSSGNGANQAMEDAISLATCLQIGGKSNISRATKIHNKLRFQRVACVQLIGFINHQRQNNTDFDVIDPKGDSFKSTVGMWCFSHNPEEYAYANYGKVLHHLVSGADFQSTNIPPGYTYRPWSIQEMFDTIRKGQKLQFEGDWS